MMNKKEKMFVVKKYIMARSAKEALDKDLKTPADDCWVDEEWRKNDKDKLADAIGFQINDDEE